MFQSNDCKIVECKDRNCKLCSTCNTNTMQDPAVQAYTVYTCESTNCKLCREETDVLLDLFCPFNTVEEIAEMTGKLNNIAEYGLFINDDVAGKTEPLQAYDFGDLCTTSEGKINVPNLQQQSLDDLQMLRAVLPNTPGQMNDRHGTDLEIIQNLQPVDESLLTILEKELQVDQLEDLPELMDICDFISR